MSLILHAAVWADMSQHQSEPLSPAVSPGHIMHYDTLAGQPPIYLSAS